MPFGRALVKLNVKILCAISSQAKGRVERANRTPPTPAHRHSRYPDRAAARRVSIRKGTGCEPPGRAGHRLTRALSAPGAEASRDSRPDAEHFSSEEALPARIGRIHASAVVLDLSAGPLETQGRLRHLLTAARCPIVVVGAR